MSRAGKFGDIARVVAGTLLLACGLAGQSVTGTLLAFVTDAHGSPEAGARVQVRQYGLHKNPVLRTTGLDGSFSLAGLAPGLYYIDVAVSEQIGARRAVAIRAQEQALLTITLPALVQSARLSARERSPQVQDEEFRWVLRSANNSRPVLRVLDGSSLAPNGLAGDVALSAGSGGQAFDSAADVTTSFDVQTPLWGRAALAFSGDTGVNLTGNSRLQATFIPDADQHARIIAAVRELDSPLPANLPRIRVFSFNVADATDVGDSLHVQYGALLTGVSWITSPYTIEPYARVAYRLGPNARLEYRFAEAAPPLHFEDDYAQSPLRGPRMTLTGFRPHLEQARHNELGYSDELTAVDLLEVGAYTDRFTDAQVSGAYAPGALIQSGNVLPDWYSQTFAANGGNYSSAGVRAVYTHRINSDVSATLAYTTGTVLAPASTTFRGGEFAGVLAPIRESAVTLKLAGQLPVTHTRLICSYRRLQHPSATTLDPYDDSPAQSDSYANVFVRQPLPRLPLVASRVEALAEFHNLLAQGYMPVQTADGQSFYFIQSARAFRGGVSFSF